ncbi:alpha/beta hydrolase [Actinoplanes sp. NPDC048796]|uniref:alpha/beta hydrolase n=1 Tax=unclassified Actinoplanes TaxID=2626549 RepID=UPI003407775A
MTDSRPPYDAELEPVLAALSEHLPQPMTSDMIGPMRAATASPPVETLLAGRPIEHLERVVPGPDGGPGLTVSIFRRVDHAAAGPGIFHTHGGGGIMGDRFVGADVWLEWVEEFDAVAVSVEYRLAPEHPDPAAVEDSYAALLWTAEHAGELGFDPARLLIAGESAGGGLAAAVALLARDRRGPALIGQLLMYPMLDDRNDTVSSHQYVGTGTWDRGSNEMAWNARLGGRRHGGEVSVYSAPTRATDLSGLPPAFIDVGSAELLRDEDVAYATALWAAGGQAELHVWPGAFHGFDQIAPQAAISRIARSTRTDWVARLFTAASK